MGARHHLTFGIVLSVVLLATAGSGLGVTAQQAPPASTQAEATVGTGVITGLVIAADNALPVRRARVSVAGGPPPPPGTGPVATATLQFAGGATLTRTEAITDANGRFEVRDLPDGVYSVNVQPPVGFIAPRSTAPVRVEGNKAAAVTVKLERAGAVEGRVLDADGEPLANAFVRAMSWTSMGGTRRLVQRTGSSTNDLGQFRLFGLPAGEYLISARSPSVGSRADIAAPAPGFVPTYFPGSADIAGATPVTVRAGADVSGIDIPLQSGILATITSRVTLPDGEPLAGDARLSVTLVSAADGQPMPISSNGRDTTAFRFLHVAPGDYYLSAHVAPASGTWSSFESPARPGAIVPVHVAGANVAADLELNLGASVSGSVRFEGQAPAIDPETASSSGIRSVGPAQVTVAARPVTVGSFLSALSAGRPAQVSEDGTFSLTGLRGQFLFNAFGGTLKSVRLNDRDITGTPIELTGTENLDGLEVTLTREVGRIRGRVLDQDGRPFGQAMVQAIPAEPERIFVLSPFVKSTGTIDSTLMPARTGALGGAPTPTPAAGARSTGDFTLPPLVAGRYRLIAYDRNANPADWPDVDTMRKIAATGTAVTVDAGKMVTVDLKLSPWPGGAVK